MSKKLKVKGTTKIFGLTTMSGYNNISGVNILSGQSTIENAKIETAHINNLTIGNTQVNGLQPSIPLEFTNINDNTLVYQNNSFILGEIATINIMSFAPENGYTFSDLPSNDLSFANGDTFQCIIIGKLNLTLNYPVLTFASSINSPCNNCGIILSTAITLIDTEGYIILLEICDEYGYFASFNLNLTINVNNINPIYSEGIPIPFNVNTNVHQRTQDFYKSLIKTNLIKNIKQTFLQKRSNLINTKYLNLLNEIKRETKLV